MSMSNGVRHVLGLVAGLFLPALILLGLFWASGEFTLSAQRFLSVSWAAVGVMVLVGIALAFLASSRLSPVASLLGGLQYVVVGLLPLLEVAGFSFVRPRWLPMPLSSGYMNVSYTGALFILGVLLLAASALPSRWRGRPAPVAVAPPPGPYAPPGPQYPPATAQPSQEPWQDDATRPMHRE
jgi:hypothetical protein